MVSIFFQISNKDYLEAMKVYDHPGKEFALRIVSFNGGMVNYVYLNDVSLQELSLLASILRLRVVSGLTSVNQLYRYDLY